MRAVVAGKTTPPTGWKTDLGGAAEVPGGIPPQHQKTSLHQELQVQSCGPISGSASSGQ